MNALIMGCIFCALGRELRLKCGELTIVALEFRTRDEVVSPQRRLFQVIRKLKSIICRFVLRVMQWQADCEGGGKGVEGLVIAVNGF